MQHAEKLLYPEVRLKPNKEEALKRFHPWIFSGAIGKVHPSVKQGDIVCITNSYGGFLAIGSFEAGNIAVKVLSYKNEKIDNDFFVEKISNALALRNANGLLHQPETNAWRLVHSEGDHLPGLIIDVYHKTAVMQTQSAGMYQMHHIIADSVMHVLGEYINAVYHKNTNTQQASEEAENGYLIGTQPESQIVMENGLFFLVDWEKGQKTGFFIDQRDARLLLGQYCAGKKLLNTFSYSGGFSVYALSHGADHVVSVDSSASAIQLCDANVELNRASDRHQSVCVDAKKYLEQMQFGEFDVIVLDPPAFAKNHQNRHKGLMGYKYINQKAIEKISSGGILFTFSCSQAIDKASFQSLVMAASLETGRKVQILHQLSQPADHPINIYHPEGSYLKGLVLRVL